MAKYINRAAAIYIICWVFYPFMQIGTIYRVLVIACAGLWFLTAIASDMELLDRNGKFVLKAGAVVLCMIMWRVLLYESLSKAVTQTLQIIILLLVALIALYYQQRDGKFLNTLFTIILASLAVFCITTIQGIMRNPYAARIANSEWLHDRFKGNEMVGLYGYVYMCVFIEPMLLYLIIKKIKINKYVDLLVRICFVEIMAMVLVSGYMIAICCCVGSCIMLKIFSKKHIGLLVVLLFLGTLFVIYYKEIMNSVFTFLMKCFEGNGVYYDKMRDFRMLFLGDASGTTVQSRFSNYEDSIANVIAHPLLGCYFFGEAGGGGHSTIIDAVGRFGVFIGAAFLNLLLAFPHKINGAKRKWNILDYTVLVFTVVFGFLDPVFQEIGVAIYIVFPLVIRLSNEASHKNIGDEPIGVHNNCMNCG